MIRGIRPKQNVLMRKLSVTWMERDQWRADGPMKIAAHQAIDRLRTPKVLTKINRVLSGYSLRWEPPLADRRKRGGVKVSGETRTVGDLLWLASEFDHGAWRVLSIIVQDNLALYEERPWLSEWGTTIGKIPGPVLLMADNKICRTLELAGLRAVKLAGEELGSLSSGKLDNIAGYAVSATGRILANWENVQRIMTVIGLVSRVKVRLPYSVSDDLASIRHFYQRVESEAPGFWQGVSSVFYSGPFSKYSSGNRCWPLRETYSLDVTRIDQGHTGRLSEVAVVPETMKLKQIAAGEDIDELIEAGW